MNVIVHQIIAVLQVLTFGNTVRSNKNVKFILASRKQDGFSLRDRRKAGQHCIQIDAQFRYSRFTVYRTRNLRCFKPKFFFRILAYIRIQIVGGIRKSGKDDDFSIAGIDRIRNLVFYQPEQRL